MAVFAIGSVLLLGFAVIGVLIVVFALTRRKRRIGQPSCGQCGYAVEGLESLRCPECGSDLRHVGIIAPQMSRPFPPLAWAIIWTILLPIPALVLSAMVAAALPQRYVSTSTVQLNGPASGAYRGVLITAIGEGATPRGGYQSVEIDLRRTSGDVVSADVDLQTLEFSTSDTPTQDLTPEALAAWFESQSINVNSAVSSEIADVLTQVNTARAGANSVSTASFSSVSSSSGTMSKPSLWFAPVAIAFWLVAWLGGVWLILRRGRATEST